MSLHLRDGTAESFAVKDVDLYPPFVAVEFGRASEPGLTVYSTGYSGCMRADERNADFSAREVVEQALDIINNPDVRPGLHRTGLLEWLASVHAQQEQHHGTEYIRYVAGRAIESQPDEDSTIEFLGRSITAGEFSVITGYFITNRIVADNESDPRKALLPAVVDQPGQGLLF